MRGRTADKTVPVPNLAVADNARNYACRARNIIAVSVYKVNGAEIEDIMTGKHFEDHAPEDARLTSYDEDHLEDYLYLLDADDEGADWRNVAEHIFGIDPAAEPDRAQSMHASHLARARWMTEIGYAYLLGPRATK